MPLQAPLLDDRTFNDIMAEARALIPRYTREWTDHNESDPGMTLVQLFAWMTEMLLYRVNRVPEASHIKFLQLLGIELKPAQPARVELTFTAARKDIQTFIVPKGTRVAVAGGDDGPPPVFELEEALVGLGATLKAIQSFDGFAYGVETAKNAAAGQWFYPFGPQARAGSALLLGFESPLDFPSAQVNLSFAVYTTGLKPEGRHCDMDLSLAPTAACLVWEYWDGKYWTALSVDKDETRAFTRSGHVYFTGPGKAARKDRVGSVQNEPLYWLRCRMDRGEYETPPRLEMVLTNTARASQALTVRDEVVGGSDGRPNQVYRLANTPVVTVEKPRQINGADGRVVKVTSVQLEVDEGLGYQAWQEVDDFFASGPDDPHFVCNHTTGEVRFGDGIRHGRIPVANPVHPNDNIVARWYLFGGGQRGNVGADTVTELQTYVEAVKRVTNLRPAFGGSDEESLEEAKLRAPRQLKSKDRAVTAEDFETMAVDTPGVRIRRATALPLVHPNFPGTRTPGVVTVIVVPESKAPNPLPSEATLATVCQHLNLHRLLTAELFVVAPNYHQAEIRADVIVRADFDLAEVKHDLENRLAAYFHPLTGGELGQGWPFGGTIFYSEVYRVVLQTPGVARIKDNQLEIWLDGERQTFCRDVPIDAGELVFSDGHRLNVTYDTGGQP